MRITLNQSDIADYLKADKYAGWSYKGAKALAEYLDENHDLEEEFDATAIRCEFAEYSSASGAATDFGWEYEEEDEEAKDQLAYEWLESRTLVLEIEPRDASFHSGGGVIIRTDF